MARKKAIEEIVESAEKTQEESVSHSNAPQFKAWGDRTNEERRDSYNEYARAIIAKSIKDDKMFWGKDYSAKQLDDTMPYNASKGATYSGITSILLRAVTEMNGYEKPSFLTMQQANFLGAKLKKEIGEDGKPVLTKNGKEAYVKGVKIALMKEYDYRDKLNSQGQPIMRDVQTKDGIQQKPVKEKFYLPKPVLETITLYHISQFDNLDFNKLKERDLNPIKTFRENLKNEARDYRPDLSKIKLTSRTQTDLENFLNSQAKGIDYKKIQTRENTQEQKQAQTQQHGRGR